MGWKSIKEHYKIEHHVQICAGNLYIGSDYVHDLLSVTPEGVISTKLFPTTNADLNRYHDEISADIERFKRLLQQHDSFEQGLKVYTYSDGQVFEKLCEEYGWPNITHDGEMMMSNTFFKTKSAAIKYGVNEEKERMKWLAEAVEEYTKKVEGLEADMCRTHEHLKRLEGMAV